MELISTNTSEPGLIRRFFFELDGDTLKLSFAGEFSKARRGPRMVLIELEPGAPWVCWRRQVSSAN
jgi:hypothetical protein